MHDLLVIDESTVRQLLTFDELSSRLRSAFEHLSAGHADVPPRTAATSPKGLLGAMPGYLPDVGLAIKMVTVFDDNEALGLPSHQGLIALFDPECGSAVALMDGTSITAIRTAAAAALAAECLARPEVRTLAILGAGVQGATHLEAFRGMFNLDEIRVASRSAEKATALARRSPIGRACDDFESAVRGADIVCCCTDSRQPVIQRNWLGRGTHVSSVGRHAELGQDILADAGIFVEWRGAVTEPPPAGAAELQGLDPGSVTELGEVLLGRRLGRRDDNQLTVYKSTGHAVEDAAAAGLVYRRATELGVGTRVSV